MAGAHAGSVAALLAVLIWLVAKVAGLHPLQVEEAVVRGVAVDVVDLIVALGPRRRLPS